MSEKWWDMSDDELDDLFREASDEFDVPFDLVAYNKLRQKIAEKPMSDIFRRFKKRWLFLLAGLILMVGVGLVYRFGSVLNKNNSIENVEHENSLEDLNTLASKTKQNRDSKSSKSKNLVNNDAVSSLSKENIIEKSEVSVPTTSPTKEKSISVSTLNKNQKIKKGDLLINQNKKKLEQPNAKDDKTYSQSKIENNLLNNSGKIVEDKNVSLELNDQKMFTIEQNKVIENTDVELKNSKNIIVGFKNSKKNKNREKENHADNVQINEHNTLPVSETISTKNPSEETVFRTNFYGVDYLKNKDSKLLLTEVYVELPDYVDSLPRAMKPVEGSKFGVRLVISPDFNSIDNLGKTNLGGSMGLLFEYKISNKLIIQTGMVYSSKSYVGSFDDYRNWKEWKSNHPSKPTEVDGGCKIFDIPINLKFNLFQKPKQTWFISSGVSSYWMISESYTYNYLATPAKTTNWNDNSKYYFSVLNLSFGLERQISKRLSLQVEPYLKTPLKNVGRGGVNLYSSGVLFSTKYNF